MCADAMDVPESVATAYGLPAYVERMFSPGANTSTHLPWLEKYVRSSASVDAPTVIALSAVASEFVHASRLSLPAISQHVARTRLR